MNDQGIYVGMLYIGAIIENSAFHTWTTKSEAGARNWGPTVDPEQLADLLWNMHLCRDRAEVRYPEDILRNKVVSGGGFARNRRADRAPRG